MLVFDSFSERMPMNICFTNLIDAFILLSQVYLHIIKVINVIKADKYLF